MLVSLCKHTLFFCNLEPSKGSWSFSVEPWAFSFTDNSGYVVRTATIQISKYIYAYMHVRLYTPSGWGESIHTPVKITCTGASHSERVCSLMKIFPPLIFVLGFHIIKSCNFSLVCVMFLSTVCAVLIQVVQSWMPYTSAVITRRHGNVNQLLITLLKQTLKFFSFYPISEFRQQIALRPFLLHVVNHS